MLYARCCRPAVCVRLAVRLELSGRKVSTAVTIVWLDARLSMVYE